MKKYIAAVLLLITNFVSSAQIQRTVKQKNDSTAIKQPGGNKTEARKDMFRQLDLTKEQRAKIKEINQTFKASKEVIENDTAISETEKKEKLKTLKKEQFIKIQTVLTGEQKIKLKQLRKERDMKDSE